MKPRLSVLLPVHNAADTLTACLESLKLQTFSDFEIVAVDHASEDSSREILKDWAMRDARLHIVRSQASSLPNVLNEGIAQCEGELIARMDADDLSLPARFARQIQALDRDPRLSFTGARVQFFGEGEISEGTRQYGAWVNSLATHDDVMRELFIECPLPHPTWLARREVFEKHRYFDDGMPEDYHLLLRAAAGGMRMAKPEGVLLRWREHPRRHSRQHPRYGRPAFMKLRARFLRRMVIKDSPCILWGAGDRARLLARNLLDEGATIKNVVGWTPEGSQSTTVHGVEVIPPDAIPFQLPGPLIVCVGSPGVRDEVRAWAMGRYWVEGKDFWFAS